MADSPQSKFETTWWQKIGETDWQPSSSGLGQFKNSIFKCVETGEERQAPDLPCGALYALGRDDDDGPNDFPPVGADGLSVACVCVYNGWRHHWYIEHRASNCTMKDDKEHRCWVRHGTIGEKVTVDKNGKTCGAGAGSLFMGTNHEWHGFLRNGVLTP